MLGPGENPPPAADSGSDESSESAHKGINYARLPFEKLQKERVIRYNMRKLCKFIYYA